MKATLLRIGILGASMYLSGCAPVNFLYRADPVSIKTIWYAGEEFQTKTKDSLTVSVAFENEVGGTMIFYVVIGNDGDDTVLAAPERLYYYGAHQAVWNRTNYADDFAFATSDTVIVTDTMRAIDPEGQLMGIDEQMEQANATYAAKAGMNAAARILQVVGDIATIGKKKTEEQQKEERHTDRSLDRSEAENAATYNSTVNQLNNERDYWQNATLRKTTLFPNDAIAGKVSFPVDPSLKSFKLIVPIDTTVFEFDFKQTQIAN